MSAVLYVLIFFMVFCFYMLIRNHMVHHIRGEFIDYFFYHDVDGHKAGNIFFCHVAGYDEMMLKFWVWHLDSFYPAYKNRNKI